MKKTILKVITALALGATIFAGPTSLHNDTSTVTAKSYSSPKPGSWKGFKKVKIKQDIYICKMKKALHMLRTMY